MGASATLPIVVTPTGRLLLAPLDQYNPYVDGIDCKLCGENIGAPHAIGCIYGDGFEDVNVIEARAIAAERIDQAGGRIAEDFLNEFHIGRTHRDIVVDDVLHAVEGTRVLVRAIAAPGSLEVFMVSMATGDVLRLPRRQFNAITTDADGRLIEAGTMVEELTQGWRGTVTTVDFGTKTVMAKGKFEFAQRGDHLRVLDQITLRWETTVVESHHADFPLVDVAKAIGIDTNGKTPDETRQEVQAATGLYAEIHIGTSRRLLNLDAMLCEVEIDPVHRDNNCHPSTDSRTLIGHGEG